MLKLLRHARLFAPEERGVQDLLIGGGKVLQIAADLGTPPTAIEIDVVELDGRITFPGLIDGHAHLTGGGGESGPESRVPPLLLSQFTTAAITSTVGVLGTDDLTRSPESLLAAARGLCAEGLSAWCHTGGYHLPPVTITGSVRGDIVHIDRMLGLGEVALSDHRSSQPTFDELLRLASEVHVAGLMTGKAGILHLHMGDGGRGLELVERALREAEIPPRVYNPTHVNRRQALFEEACSLATRGVTIDVTAFPVPSSEADEIPADEIPSDEIPADHAVVRYLDAELPAARLTVSSDGGGCLPSFDEEGRVDRFEVGRPGELIDCLRRLHHHHGRPLEHILPPFTSNAAGLLRLQNKGRIFPGGDADLVVTNDDLAVEHVLCNGEWMVRDGVATRHGLFENASPGDSPTR